MNLGARDLRVECADVLDWARDYSGPRFHALLCDPPYELGFMGKKWDAQGVSFQPETWAALAEHLLPGAMVLAFGGTRTWHRLACALEDAGLEIRDTLMWVYGSGFPKSLDISKAIDKAGGGCGMPANDRLAFAAELREKRQARGISRAELASWFPQYSEVTKNWERLDPGFRVPCEIDFGVLVERLGVSENWRLRVRAEDKRRLLSDDGVDRRNDGTVIGLGHTGKEWGSSTDLAHAWSGYGTSLKPAWEPIIVAMKPLDGTFAANALAHGVAGINVSGCRIPAADKTPAPVGEFVGSKIGPTGHLGHCDGRSDSLGRWPANLIHDGSAEVLELFPVTKSGVARNGERGKRPGGFGDVGADKGDPRPCGELYGDSGSAARFFYCAKASRAEREAGLAEHPERSLARSNAAQADAARGEEVTRSETSNGLNTTQRVRNNHPTVKPIALTRYLATLILPPECSAPRRLLVPFAGSGSEMIGAMQAGWEEVVGIEREEEYVEIAEARIKHADGLVGACQEGR